MNARPPFEAHRRDLDKVLRILQKTPAIDREYMAPREEFQERVRRTNQVLQQHGHTVGLVFSDEHYAGDVPYLGGNTNISIEQVAGIVGPKGFHVVAGLEGGYVAEQLSDRAGATVHKVELLQLADEKYPIRAERLEDVIQAAAGKDVDHIALLTPRQVVPAGIVETLQKIYGPNGVVDAQELYYRVKYEKSAIEMRLIADACVIGDAMLRAMLAVLRPGRLETEVAAWGAWVGRMLGSERDGFQIMVGANTANRTLIGPALNRRINEGDWVHLGVAPKRDGLTACIRRSVIAVDSPNKVTPEQKYWFDLVEEGYKVGERSYREVASKQLPARLQEQSLVDFFTERSQEISQRIGRKIDLAAQKPYTGTHNSGYTECQEFFGAITLDSHEPLGNQIVTMLDVALRGIGDHWNDVVIPGFDFCVVENTLGKYGPRVETLTANPIRFVRQSTASNFEPIILTPAQAFAIINQLELMLRTLVLVTAATALRISEILALQWRDIDVDNQCIYVRRAYVYGRFGKPKSKASKRPVPLHPVLAAHLLNWRRETPYSKEEELVFPSFKLKGRKPPRANMLLSDHLRPAAVRVGVVAPPRAFGFHTFRRTLASVLVANNYDPKLVQELLRHSNIKTTLDIYAQAITSAKLEAQGMFLTELLKGTWTEKKPATSFVV